MKRLIVVVLLAFVSCASSTQKLYMKASSTASYAEASYLHKCKGTGNPPAACAPCDAALVKAVWQVPVAEKTVRIGYMSQQEITDLTELLKELEACP